MRRLQWALLVLILLPIVGTGQIVLGTSNWEEANAILPLADGTLVLTGKCRTSPEKDLDLFLLHLTQTGEILSAQTFGGPNQDEGLWLEPTQDGGFILAGYAFDKEGGYGRHDIYLLKFSAHLELEWERLHGRAFREIPFCIRETDFGYVIAGYTKSEGLHGDYLLMGIDKQGNALWDHYYEAPFVDFGHDVAINEDGYLIIGSTAGYHFPSQANHHYPESNVMVIRTDLNGKEIERRFYGGERHEFARSIVPTPQKDGWYIFGSVQDGKRGDFDFLLLRLDLDLNVVWRKQYGGNGCDQGSKLERKGDKLLLYGTFEEEGKFKSVVLEVDANGEELSSQKVEIESHSYGTSIRWIGNTGFVGTGYVIKNELDRDILLFLGDIQPASESDR